MVHEREPLQWADLPRLANAWLLDVGVLAAVALALWLIAYLVERPSHAGTPRWLRLVVTAGSALTLLLYGGYLLLVLPRLLVASWPDPGPDFLNYLLRWGAAAAVLTVLVPFGHGLSGLRGRRILALAGLCFKEALRGKVLWTSAALLPFFLFADWFLPHRPDSQLQVYLEAVFLVLTILFLFVPIWLASSSIPADLRLQTIHTVVTKPVQRFEIVLGRFLGYVALMTLWLAPTLVVSLVLVFIQGVHPDAAAQSLRARVPLYGELKLLERQRTIAGSQPREWQYRRSIAGGPDSPQRAVWTFQELPANLERAAVPCEFSFDIYRTSKGEGVLCTLTFQSWRWSPAQAPAYQQERAALLKQGVAEAAVADQLAEKYGWYEVPFKRVLDYHTYVVGVPAGLFRNARQDFGNDPWPPPRVTVQVKNEDRGTYLGVARHDLYLVEGERSFVANLFKGAAGIWFRICLVTGLAVAFSTYFSGIISFVLTLLLYLGGLAANFIQQIAFKTGDVVGPAESFKRIVSPGSSSAPLEPTPFNLLIQQVDEVFRLFFRFLLKLLPDVERFSLTDYVASGFDISFSLLGMLFLVLLGYLLPCAVLAYYLMKNREIGG